MPTIFFDTDLLVFEMIKRTCRRSFTEREEEQIRHMGYPAFAGKLLPTAGETMKSTKKE